MGRFLDLAQQLISLLFYLAVASLESWRFFSLGLILVKLPIVEFVRIWTT